MINVRKLEADLQKSADLLRVGSKLTSKSILHASAGADFPALRI